MTLPVVFAGLTSATGSNLDQDFNAVGLLGTIPCAVSGTNALTLTPFTSPTIGTPPLALQQQVRVSGIAAATNTTSVTANVSGLGALSIYKDGASGPVVLSGNEIVIHNYFVLAYDPALNSGAGGWHLGGAASSGAGTSIVAGAGLAGGTISSVGTISIASIAAQRLFANITGGAAAPIANTLTAILDNIVSSTQGALLTRGASVWGSSVETSWSPAVAFGASSIGITYGTQVGQYLAIGNVIVAFYNIALTSKGAQTGSATVSLPVAAGGTNRVGGGLMLNYANLTSVTTGPWAYVAPSATTANLLIAGSATVANVMDTNFANNTSLSGILVYFSG